MIPLIVNSKEIQIPTKWQDVTWKQYVSITSAPTPENILSTLTGLSFNQPLFLLGEILTLLSFVDSHCDLATLSTPYKGKNVALEEYGKLEKAKAVLKGKETPMLAGADLVKIYTGEDINDLPVTEVYNKVSFFLSACQSSLTGTNG